MAINNQKIEQKLDEFVQVNGTVLLGMHKELQSQQKAVDEKLRKSKAEITEFFLQQKQKLETQLSDIKTKLSEVEIQRKEMASQCRAAEKMMTEVNLLAQDLRIREATVSNRIRRMSLCSITSIIVLSAWGIWNLWTH